MDSDYGIIVKRYDELTFQFWAQSYKQTRANIACLICAFLIDVTTVLKITTIWPGSSLFPVE